MDAKNGRLESARAALRRRLTITVTRLTTPSNSSHLVSALRHSGPPNNFWMPLEYVTIAGRRRLASPTNNIITAAAGRPAGP
jgi:hypothetical protein